LKQTIKLIKFIFKFKHGNDDEDVEQNDIVNGVDSVGACGGRHDGAFADGIFKLQIMKILLKNVILKETATSAPNCMNSIDR
jgi:hypothetical protein